MLVLLGIAIAIVAGSGGGGEHGGGGEARARTERRQGCFRHPSVCGFPDPTDTGVEPRVGLKSFEGEYAIETDGATVEAKDITGSLKIDADNVTVRNVRVTNSGSCPEPCGNYAIKVKPGSANVVLEHVETRSQAGKICEHDVRNEGEATVTLRYGYLHACDSNWYGSGAIEDSYGIAKEEWESDHVENVYLCGGTITVHHSTLFNPEVQAAVIFGETTCGGNVVRLTDNLFAGGGFTLQPQAKAAGEGSSAGQRTTITGNHFARCLGKEVRRGGGLDCEGGADGFGYYPNGGFYGYVRNEGLRYIWKDNVWDDNLSEVSD
jgi:hypothetical protein